MYVMKGRVFSIIMTRYGMLLWFVTQIIPSNSTTQNTTDKECIEKQRHNAGAELVMASIVFEILYYARVALSTTSEGPSLHIFHLGGIKNKMVKGS